MEPKSKTIRNLLWLIKPYHKYGRIYLVIFLLMGVFVIPVEEYIYVTLPRNIVNMLASGTPFIRVAIFTGVMLVINFLVTVLPTVFSPYLGKRGNEIALKINRDVYEQALKIDYKYIDQPDYYDKYSWALDEYKEQAKAARDLIRDFLTNVVSVSILFTLIVGSAPWILFLEIFKLGLDFFIAKQRNLTMIEYRKNLVPIQRRLSYVHRIFYQKEYSPYLRATSLRNLIFNSYDKSSEKSKDTIEFYNRKVAVWDIISDILFLIVQITIYVYIVYLIASGQIPEVGLFITLTISFYRLDERLTYILRAFTKGHELSLNSEKIQEFFNMESHIENVQENTLIPHSGPFSIELKNVFSSYPNTDFALKNINLKIEKGQKIAIVGHNGAGKTTLVKMLLRFYDVTEGGILINGENIELYNISALRKQIGVAFQNSQIYAASFADNIQLYRQLNQEEIFSITSDLELKTNLEQNNETLNLELTREFADDEIMLSGGEKQKIAIARIMGGDFGLLVLDEPSSALDPLSEYKLTQLLLSQANKTTTIMISHRLSTVRDADKIILVNYGNIEEVGTHQELMNLHGIYFDMFTKQAEKYLD